MYRDRTIGLVLPARNEERLILRTLTSVPDYVDSVYVVDDASIDRTRDLVRERATSDARVRLLCHEENVGPGGAIITGYRQASLDGCDLVAVSGADAQMPFDQLGDLLDPLIEEEVDYTKGNRFMMDGDSLKDMPKVRLIFNTFLSFLTKVSSGYFKVFDVVDGFTAITKRAIDAVDWDHVWVGYGYPMDFLVHLNVLGFRVKDVPRRAIYLKDERQSQIRAIPYASTVIPLLIGRFFWRVRTRYVFRDFHPLVFLYAVSFMFIPLGFLIGAYIVWTKLSGLPPSGATAVACALCLNLGVQSLFFAFLFDMMEGQ